MTQIQLPAGITLPVYRAGMEDTITRANTRARILNPNHIDDGVGDDNPFYNLVLSWFADGVTFMRISDDLEQLVTSSELRDGLLEDEDIQTVVALEGDLLELPRYVQFNEAAHLDEEVPDDFPNRWQDPPTNSIAHTWNTWYAQATNITFPFQSPNDNKWYGSLIDYSDPLRKWLKATAYITAEPISNYTSLSRNDYIAHTATDPEP